MPIGGMEEFGQSLIVFPTTNADEMLPPFVGDQFQSKAVRNCLLSADPFNGLGQAVLFHVIEMLPPS